MTKWSITRAAMAAALVSVAAAPALAQDDWAPPQQSPSAGYRPQPAAGQQDESDRGADDTDQTSDSGGFASRDAAPPDSTAGAPSEDKGWSNWHSDSPSPTEPEAAGDDRRDGAPDAAPGTVNSFDQPETVPGFQASTGITNRGQAVSGCLAAVRARIGGGAGAARVDGIRGEWMVSGAIDDGRAFYCAVHGGTIDDIEFGS